MQNSSQTDTPSVPHHLSMEDRSRVSITGVTRVISCDETGAVIETEIGRAHV